MCSFVHLTISLCGCVCVSRVCVCSIVRDLRKTNKICVMERVKPTIHNTKFVSGHSHNVGRLRGGKSWEGTHNKHLGRVRWIVYCSCCADRKYKGWKTDILIKPGHIYTIARVISATFPGREGTYTLDYNFEYKNTIHLSSPIRLPTGGVGEGGRYPGDPSGKHLREVFKILMKHVKHLIDG